MISSVALKKNRNKIKKEENENQNSLITIYFRENKLLNKIDKDSSMSLS